MKIFISLKVPRGDAELDRLANLTADCIRQAGHKPFVAPYQIAIRGLTQPKDFMPFVRQHAESSALMIVFNHRDLRGGLIEMGIAYANQIPIWLCQKPGEKVSSSVRGCADLTIEYRNINNLQKHLSENLRIIPL